MNPSFILASCLLVFGMTAQATEIVRIFDGATAECANRADEMRFKTSAIYRPVSAVRLNSEEVSISVQFLKCSNERGEYGFSTDVPTRSRSIVLERGPFQDKDVTVTVERTNLKLVVYSEDGHIIDTTALKLVSGDTYNAIVKVDRDDVLFNVHSLLKITNEETGAILDSGRSILGSYRLKL